MSVGPTRVPAFFDGERVRLLEDAPVSGPYRVIVEFIEPAVEPPARDGASDERSFWQSFGSWEDSRPPEATLADIKSTRRS